MIIRPVRDRSFLFNLAMGGVLAFLLVLCQPFTRVPLAVKATDTMQRSLERSIRATGAPTVVLVPTFKVVTQPDQIAQRRQSVTRVVNWFGVTYAPAVFYQASSTRLMKSPYGDASFNPLTDEIDWTPYPRPTDAAFAWGTVRPVTTATGAAWTAANDAAQDWDIVEIQVAMSLGNFAVSFRARGTSGTVMVRDANTFGLLGPESRQDVQGERVTAGQLAAAHVISVTNTDSFCRFEDQSRGWKLRGLKIQKSGTGFSSGGLMTTIPPNQTEINQPRYVDISQCHFDNPWTLAVPTNCQRALSPNCEFMWFTDSRVTGMFSSLGESQALNTSNGIGNFRIENCELEAVTETIMWGGSNLAFHTVLRCRGIFVRRCWFHRRADWMNSGNGLVYTAQKNFKEWKDGGETVYEGNECEGFSGVGQQYDINIKYAPQNQQDRNFVYSHDIWIRHCRFSNSNGKFDVGGVNNLSLSSNPGTHRIEISNCLWLTTRGVGQGWNQMQSSGTNPPTNVVADLYIHNNTADSTNAAMNFGGNSAANPGSQPGFRFNDNVFSRVITVVSPRSNSSEGNRCLNEVAGVGGWQFSGNVMEIGSQTATFWWGGANPSQGFVAGNYGGTSLIFANEGTGDYDLTDSRFQIVSTSGGRPGVNMTRLNLALAGVIS